MMGSDEMAAYAYMQAHELDPTDAGFATAFGRLQLQNSLDLGSDDDDDEEEEEQEGEEEEEEDIPYHLRADEDDDDEEEEEEEALLNALLPRALVTSGARVQISGLSARPDLNGRFGVAQHFAEPQQRWNVRLEPDDELVLVKAEKLAVISIEAGASGAAATSADRTEFDVLYESAEVAGVDSSVLDALTDALGMRLWTCSPARPSTAPLKGQTPVCL